MDLALEKFAELLTYPSASTRETLHALRDELQDAHPRVYACLCRFADAIEDMLDETWEELYTRTFDVAAQCPLYLGIHLFGPENHKRPRLMTGLREVYGRQGAFWDVELPDHLAVVLRNRRAFDDNEWEELVEFCVLPSLEKMVTELGRGNNAYRFVLGALQHSLNVSQGAALHV